MFCEKHKKPMEWADFDGQGRAFWRCPWCVGETRQWLGRLFAWCFLEPVNRP